MNGIDAGKLSLCEVLTAAVGAYQTNRSPNPSPQPTTPTPSAPNPFAKMREFVVTANRREMSRIAKTEAMPELPTIERGMMLKRRANGLRDRIATLAEQRSSQMDFNEAIRKAGSLMQAGNLDAAENLVDRLLTKIRHKVTVESSSDDETHDSEDQDTYGYGDLQDAGNGNGNGNDDDEPDADEEDDEDVSKMLKDLVNPTQRVNDPTNRPGSWPSSQHPSSNNSRHKFEALTDMLANDHAIPKSEAMAQARQRYPDVYRSYQRHLSGNPGVGDTSKRATPTYEALVAREMAKGCNAEIAGQRVVQMYGADALRNRMFAKTATTLTNTLQKRANRIAERDGLSLCEALRKARQQDPTLYEAMQV